MISNAVMKEHSGNDRICAKDWASLPSPQDLEKKIFDGIKNYFAKIDQYKVKDMVEIINGKTNLSLKFLEWFTIVYSNQKNLVFPLYNKKINIYKSFYKRQRCYGGVLFCVHVRGNKISYNYDSVDETKIIDTSVGQLNFFSWLYKHNVINYIRFNYSNLEEEYEKYLILNPQFGNNTGQTNISGSGPVYTTSIVSNTMPNNIRSRLTNESNVVIGNMPIGAVPITLDGMSYSSYENALEYISRYSGGIGINTSSLRSVHFPLQGTTGSPDEIAQDELDENDLDENDVYEDEIEIRANNQGSIEIHTNNHGSTGSSGVSGVSGVSREGPQNMEQPNIRTDLEEMNSILQSLMNVRGVRDILENS